jgi:hypothetical protein
MKHQNTMALLKRVVDFRRSCFTCIMALCEAYVLLGLMVILFARLNRHLPILLQIDSRRLLQYWHNIEYYVVYLFIVLGIVFLILLACEIGLRAGCRYWKWVLAYETEDSEMLLHPYAHCEKEEPFARTLTMIVRLPGLALLRRLWRKDRKHNTQGSVKVTFRAHVFRGSPQGRGTLLRPVLKRFHGTEEVSIQSVDAEVPKDQVTDTCQSIERS